VIKVLGYCDRKAQAVQLRSISVDCAGVWLAGDARTELLDPYVRFGSGSEARSLFGMFGLARIAALGLASQVCQNTTFNGRQKNDVPVGAGTPETILPIWY